MTDDMRLLILTHLRAAMERRDWKPVGAALLVAQRNGAGSLAERLFAAIRSQIWSAVEAVYAFLGGVGAGEPRKATQQAEIGAGVAVGGLAA